MKKLLIIASIAVIIFLLTYLSAKNDKIKKAFLLSGLAAVLSFVGPYIVEAFGNEKTSQQEIPEVTANNTDDIQDEKNTSEKETEKQTENDTKIEETDITASNEEKSGEENSNNVSCITFMGETHEPSDIATQVSVSGWAQDEDYDIVGKTYDGGVKITIYNMFSALDGNSSSISNEITSEIHYALNTDEINKLAKENQRFVGKFVVGQETEGSPSTAVVSILLDGEEIYNSGEINCYSLSIPPFDVPLTGKKEMVIKTVCQHRGAPLIIGVVNNE